ncbi:hypothetical protein [Streptomyces sp. NPDC002994]|uniref:hypothetical protein n=1 Tax=Streptomyces sp. NPDC002994 TaxID=3154441 RepID=UPI0033B1020A
MVRATGTAAARRVGAALVATLGLAGCGLGDGPRICTMIGGVPGVTVIYEPGGGATAAPAGPAGPVVLRLCVDGECEERTEDRTEASTAAGGIRMYVRTPDDVRGEELDVRFSVTVVDDGRVIMKDSARVSMTPSWANGKECDGEGTWSAELTAAPDTGLVDRRR